ncbi:hypothetical protein PSH99_23365, partial [Pseudoalteromonas sp. GABNS16H]
AGQSESHGGGFFYNGDGTPTFASGETADKISFFRRSSGANHYVFGYLHNSDDVDFSGEITAASFNGDGSGLTGTSPLRATGTTKTDVGLGDVDNYSRAHYDGRYASKTDTYTKSQVDAMVADAQSAAVPAGVINMWSGSIASIPVGWALCDGTNGTPNLLDRFVIGGGASYAIGSTGGYTDAVVVSHSHSGYTSSNGDHTHSIRRSNNNGSAGGFQSGAYVGGTVTSNSAGSHTHNLIINSSGTSGAGKNIPPFYALAYIIKL